LLYGNYNWQLSSEKADIEFKQLSESLSRITHHATIKNNSNEIPHPNPPISISFKEKSKFSNEHLNGIRDAVETICLYLISLDSQTTHIVIESGYDTSGFVPNGGSVLGKAYINEKRVVFNPNMLHGIDIFFVAIHEFLHILGFGASQWNSLITKGTEPHFYSGFLVNSLTENYMVVDTQTLSHWSQHTELSSEHHMDIMEPYISEYTKLSTESFAVIQEVQSNILSVACRNTQDCNIILSHRNISHETAMCHQFASTLPGICLDADFCSTHTCSSVYTTTPVMSDRLSIITNVIAVLSVAVASGFRMFIENTHNN